jgi:hypothetical protein
LSPIDGFRWQFLQRFTCFISHVCVLARYLDDPNVQVLDGSAEDPVVLLFPHLLHRVTDSGRRGGRLHRHHCVDASARLCELVHIASAGAKKLLMHERLLPRRLGTTNLLVAQLLRARLRSDELAIDRFEPGSFSFISRVCAAMTVRNAS